MRKNPSYSVFLQCSQFTEDPFWQQQFNECAHGKFPRGVKFKYNPETSSGILSIRRQTGQATTYTINEQDEPEKVYNLIQNIFKTIGIFSATDDELKKAEIEEIRAGTISEQEWKKIRRKKDRQRMIMDYAIEMKNKYSLTRKQTSQLYHTIQKGIASHAIESRDVVVKKNNITQIKTIEYDNDSGRFYCINADRDEPSSTAKGKSDVIQVKDIWEKCKKQFLPAHIKDRKK